MELMTEKCARSLPALASLLVEFCDTTHLAAFGANQFRTTSFAIACDIVVSARCLFMPMNLHMLSLVVHFSELAASLPGEFRDLVEPVCLPGCMPILGLDIVSPL
jgi:hydroquinone glucosyltransferase